MDPPVSNGRQLPRTSSTTLFTQPQSPPAVCVCEHGGPCDCAEIEQNKFYFVTPSGQSKDTVSEFMKYAHGECVAREFPVEWVKESRLNSLGHENGSVFVLDRFEGKGFKYLEDLLAKHNNFMIIGPQVLNYLFEKDVKESFKTSGFPIFTLAMSNIVIATTGISGPALEELVSKVQTMGGTYESSYTSNITHLVAVTTLLDKTVAAKKTRLIFMKPDWVNAVWNQSLVEHVHGNDPGFAIYQTPMFFNLNFSFSQMSSKEKKTLQRIIEENGGVYSADLVRKASNVLVLPKGEGDKFNYAMDWKMLCIKPEWITDSRDAGYALGTAAYLVTREESSSAAASVVPGTRVPPHLDMSSCSIFQMATPSRSVSRVIDYSRIPEFNSSVMTGAGEPPAKEFLNGVIVYFSGKSRLDEAKQLLERTGAIPMDILFVIVTHIVVLEEEITKRDLERIKSLEPWKSGLPHVVGFDWLVESSRKQCRADEDIFIFRLPPLLQEEENDGTEMEEKICTVDPNQSPQKVPSSDGGSCPSGDQILDDPTMCGREETCLDEDDERMSTPQPVNSIFEGKKFLLSFEDDVEGHEMTVDMIISLGGTIVTKGFDFVITTPLHSDSFIMAYSPHTEYWIMDCDEVDSIEIEEKFYHLPLLKNEGIRDLLKGVVVAISSYSFAERSFLSAMASYMGAIVQDVFSIRGRKNIIPNTHLICGNVENEKCNAARRWRLPVVTCHWILNSYREGSRLDERNFAPGLLQEEPSLSTLKTPPVPLTQGPQPGPSRLSAGILPPVGTEPSINNGNGDYLFGNGEEDGFPPEENCCGGGTGELETPGGGTTTLTTPMNSRVMALGRRRLSIGGESPLSQRTPPSRRSPPYHYVVDRFYGTPDNSTVGLQPLIPMPPSPETPKLIQEWEDNLRRAYPKGSPAIRSVIEDMRLQFETTYFNELEANYEGSLESERAKQTFPSVHSDTVLTRPGLPATRPSSDDVTPITTTEKLRPEGEQQRNNAALRRSRSNPNLAQMSFEDPPTYNRSQKPQSRRDITTASSTQRSHRTGLKNFGNTCYMNSIVQCLSHTRDLETFLTSEDVRRLPSGFGKTRGEVTKEVGGTIQQLHLCQRFIAPEELKRVIGKYHAPFRGYTQHDSHELLTFLLDWMHEELNKSTVKKLKEQQNDNVPDEVASARFWEEFLTINDSPISRLFAGEQRSCLKCLSCQKESVTFDTFNILSIPIPNKGSDITLANCLDLYMSLEVVTDLKCAHCKANGKTEKKFDLWRLPKYLIIHLQRFHHNGDGNFRKRINEVDCPLVNLDMATWVKGSATKRTLYNLYAISNHYGSMENGHYTAFCRNPDSWTKFDDSEVSTISSREVCTTAAYILFYQLQDNYNRVIKESTSFRR